MRCLTFLSLLFAALAPLSVRADWPEPEDRVLRFDPLIQPPPIEPEHPLSPEADDLQLLGFRPMSNDLGERWALVTIKNTSSGHRFLHDQALVATFADGSQRYAKNLDERLDGWERKTVSAYFGLHVFPIVDVTAGGGRR